MKFSYFRQYFIFNNMKAVIQRVLSASVTVNNEVVSSIKEGLCVLIGICKEDTDKDMEYIVRKLLNLKLFENSDGKKWSTSVMDKEYEILCVSQFTLYSTLKGNKLDFHHAMPSTSSAAFYNKFLQSLALQYNPDRIKDGKFGALMEVNIVNDGPVTVHIESPKPKAEERVEVDSKLELAD